MLKNKGGVTNMLLDICRGSSYHHLILFAGENSIAEAAVLERAGSGDYEEE